MSITQSTPTIEFVRRVSAGVTYEPGPDQAATEVRPWGDHVAVPFAASRLSLRADWNGTEYELESVTIIGRRFKKSGEVGLVAAKARFTKEPRWEDVAFSELPEWAAVEVDAIMARVRDAAS